MLPRIRTLFDQQLAWAASAKQKVIVPRDAFIAVLMLRIAVTYTTNAGAPTVAEDGVLNAVSKVTLFASGKQKRSFTPRHYWKKLPLDLAMKPELLEVTTAVAAGKAAAFELPIFFRRDPYDEEQFSYLLAAAHHSSLELHVEWGAAGALGTDQVITAATATVTLEEVLLSPAEEVAMYGARGKGVFGSGSRLLEIIETEVEAPILAAAADFKFSVDLPGGSMLLRSFITILRNALRDDTQVTHLRVVDSRGTKDTLVEETIEQSQARDLREYGVPTPGFIDGTRYAKGYTVLDYLQHRPGGLDLRGVEEGAVKAQFTTIAPHANGSKLVIIHEQVDRASA